jgi:SAM-dependent MidA family methyltransferase
VDDAWLPWRTAMERALYGPAGFFVRERPADHFRTSVHVSEHSSDHSSDPGPGRGADPGADHGVELFAGAVAELLLRVDTALGHPADLAFVDMGAGRAELSLGLLRVLPAPVRARLRLYAVERAAPPPGLDPRVRWTAVPPPGARGLLFANEWLDNVPLAVAEADPAGVARYVEVRADGAERLGAPVTGEDAAWLRKWWPLGPEAAGEHVGSAGESAETAGEHTESAETAGVRAEIGLPRDRAWASAAASLSAGLAVAVDYGHTRATRPPYGTLTGYRHGRQVPPLPDGSCDLTAHVALDSLAGVPLPQRSALHSLGLSGRRPPLALATTDPAAYLRALSAAGQAAELTSPDALGAFTWVSTAVGPECAHLLAP